MECLSLLGKRLLNSWKERMEERGAGGRRKLLRMEGSVGAIAEEERLGMICRVWECGSVCGYVGGYDGIL